VEGQIRKGTYRRIENLELIRRIDFFLSLIHSLGILVAYIPKAYYFLHTHIKELLFRINDIMYVTPNI
jgi:hypothetical protein